MGNTDSFISPTKTSSSSSSSSSLRFSRREEVPLAHSWWRSRSSLNQSTSWRYDRGGPGPGLGAGSPQKLVRGNQFGFLEGGGEKASRESGGSPKVLLSKDGSVKVEFSNTRGVTMETPAAVVAPVTEPSLRTSKGSSLSSNGSWYDSPWGGGGELVDNVFGGFSSRQTSTTSTIFSAQVNISPGFNCSAAVETSGYNTCSSGRTEDSGVGDSVILRDFSLASPSCASLDSVYHNTPPPFPMPPDSSFSFPTPPDSFPMPPDCSFPTPPDSSFSFPMPPDSSISFPTPPDSSFSFPMPPDSSISFPTPPDSSFSFPTPPDSSISFPTPPDSSISFPTPPDSSFSFPTPPDSSFSFPTPPDSSFSFPTPPDSSISFPTPPDSSFSFPTPPDSSISFPTPPDSSISFPTPPDSSFSFPTPPDSSFSFPTPPDASFSSSGGVEQCYSSLTLPCRRVEPVAAVTNSRKDFLKSRLRQLSDWTGSLSRKKRRIQEPNSSKHQLWSSNPLHALNQNHNQNQNRLPAVHCGSRSLNQNQSSDLQRQNVYNSFMQELETGCSSAADWTDPEEEEEEVMDGDDGDEEEEVGGGEQLDLLLQKEQGAVRRAGWLSFKALITVNKDRKLELVARRRWKRYWVTLRGCSLLFYETYGRSGEQELAARYVLLADDGIVQPVPEHPRREHVFCLSSSHGDVYLFQATSQTDLENWVTALHSASASLLARRQGKEDTLRLLRCQSRSLLHQIDMDGKMRKMAELQLSVIKEQKNRRAVENQIQQWEQNLEKLNLDLFRLRCYLSSLQGSELPNPKSLLAVASRPSKSMLGRLGVFSVSSFHALVCSRAEEALRRRRQPLTGGGGRRRGLPSSMMAVDGHKRQSTAQRPDGVSKQREAAPPAGRPAALQVCDELQRSAVFTLNVCRLDAASDFGFAVTGHVDGAGKSHVYVSEVEPLSLSAGEGLRAGDEVLAVNGSLVSGLDLDLMQSLFDHQKLQLLLRRDQVTSGDLDPTPAPPDLQTWTSTDGVLLPVCGDGSSERREDGERQQQRVLHVPHQTFPEGRAAAKEEEEVPQNPYEREAGLQPTSPAHLSVCQRLCKVIQELVDTEKSYVKDLVLLFDVYLTPLQKESFLSKVEMEALFGSLPEMLDFQRVFLQTLEERITSCPHLSRLDTPEQFKKLLLSLGGSFLDYADHFKHYSGFCANHTKVQKVLERAKTDGAFKHFLEARNPTNQHSSSLESYLIKPVQRVLKYPLLLRELVSLTEPESLEHTHLTEALRAMEEVATHINEMQKIYEDYGCVFDQLAAEHSAPDKQVTEISMGDFLVHSSVVWLNPLPVLGRLRKEPELTLFVFKRAVVLVYRDNSRLKKRTAASRSADLDPFRFRWLIPVSAVQVRAASLTGSEKQCVWELVHSRSELEGRPETVFQLCSSGLETKAGVLQALRSVLRDRPTSLRRTRRSMEERSSSWRRRQQRSRGPSGREETCSEPLLPSRTPADPPGKRSRLCSLTSELEAQLQRLSFSEEVRRSSEEVRRSSRLQQSPGGEVLDLGGLLERDFSVQSMSSMTNEDCFYDGTLAAATLQG